MEDSMTTKQVALRELQTIPGVGKSIATDLYEVGVRKVSDLKGSDPKKLYLKRCRQQGVRIDPCLLYTFRCAVYFASRKQHRSSNRASPSPIQRRCATHRETTAGCYRG